MQYCVCINKYFGLHKIIRLLSVYLHNQDPLLGGLLSIFPVDLHDNNFTVEHSGKLRVLDMMLYQLHLQQSRDRIVLVSNYTKVRNLCIYCYYYATISLVLTLELSGVFPNESTEWLIFDHIKHI